ncbi:uncharacterized protein LOC135168298 isoform X3 [Diachasmimorpha longicaudata]|uniref:uncharacterized protein LOC135168298 isoform X3 n=1 Tax=Diachasmimorpha longicaudata TaxID=58733 RepID=UPI0030B87EF2
MYENSVHLSGLRTGEMEHLGLQGGGFEEFRDVVFREEEGNERQCCIALLVISLLMLVNAGDMMRKSIVYDKNTPDLFYCPQHKPTGFEKMIVRAKPLSRLCQFAGGPIPEDYKSDCYNDVDETEYACKEKYRIMMRLHPPGSDTPYNGTRLSKFLDHDKKVHIKVKPQ